MKYNQKTIYSNSQQKKKGEFEELSNVVTVDNAKVLDCINVNIPIFIYRVMLQIESNISNNVEFSIYTKYEFDKEKKEVNILPEYFIPKQEVSSASIKYHDDEQTLNYNTVIHKHPSGCKNFSPTDLKYINNNFNLSILWCDQDFITAQFNIFIPELNTRVQYPNVKLFIHYGDDIELVGLDNIVEHTPIHTYSIHGRGSIPGKYNRGKYNYNSNYYKSKHTHIPPDDDKWYRGMDKFDDSFGSDDLTNIYDCMGLPSDDIDELNKINGMPIEEIDKCLKSLDKKSNKKNRKKTDKDVYDETFGNCDTDLLGIQKDDE